VGRERKNKRDSSVCETLHSIRRRAVGSEAGQDREVAAEPDWNWAFKIEILKLLE
jgi:hypothetical protein